MRYYFIILIILLLFTGCERLKRWDAKVGEIFFSGEVATTTQPFWEDLGTKVKERIASSTEKIMEDVDIKEFVKDLSKEQKDKIEDWIKEEGKNRYGDPEGTYYTGGTPLFDETTGETKERFEYLIENHKELINILQ